MARDRGHSDQPTEPKPNFWVGLLSEPVKNKPTDHDRFVGYSGRLELQLEVTSDYLYVGSGSIGLTPVEPQQAYYTFARSNDMLVIPGTGIKGAVRAIVEAISNSCVSQVGRQERERISEKYKTCDGDERLCLACRLFGTTGYRGRVHFAEAKPITSLQPEIIKIADLWPPKISDKGRKFYASKKFQPQDNQNPERSHRFIEVVPKKSVFKTTLFFENLDVAEMGVLVRAIGLDYDSTKNNVILAFPIKLGGAKPRCLGATFFNPIGLHTIPTTQDLFLALRKGGVQPDMVSTLTSWLQDNSLVENNSWESFKRQAKNQNESCPKELY